MILRKIVQIDEEKCNGCGQCVPACHEGAIEIIDGKAKLITDKLCDGLGDCLGECPLGAIQIIERDADDYDQEAVKARQEELRLKEIKPAKTEGQPQVFSGCPGSKVQSFTTKNSSDKVTINSELRQWPVQLHLLPVKAEYFNDVDLLIGADCVPIAYPNFHQELLKDKTIAIACPKLDNTEPYLNKLTEIFKNNKINSITIARMEVPCCGGLSMIVKQAVLQSQIEVPIYEKIISVHGEILA